MISSCDGRYALKCEFPMVHHRTFTDYCVLCFRLKVKQQNRLYSIWKIFLKVIQ